MNEKIDLSALFKSDEEAKKELNSLTKYSKKITSYEGKLLSSPEKLFEYLEYDSNISKRLERLYLYAHINNDLDLTNENYNNMLGSVLNFINDLNEKESFVVPELLEKDFSDIKDFIKKFPKLKEYENELKSIYKAKKYIKSKEEEKLITLLSSVYSKSEDSSELLLTTDMDFGYITNENGEKVKLTISNFSTYIKSSSQSVRLNAFENLYKEIAHYENTFNSIYTTKVMSNNKIAKIRGFKTARSLSLYCNYIKNDIYDNLINSIKNNLPVFYKYYDLKKKALGLKELHIYDTYANITKDFDKTYSYDDAKNLVLSSLEVMGKDYINVIKKAFDERWIDVLPKKNKREGGYCTCAYLAHPYVVINYEGKLDDVSTLIHELGHAMHYYYAQNYNTYEDYNYSIFVAEVASQVNEIILTNYMLNHTDDINEKKYILDSILQRFKATMIRQTMFAHFEDNIHNKEISGEVLTKELVQKEYLDLNKLYFGPNVVVDDYIKYECYRIPHFYYNFYVYQYATGYAAALKIANDIINKKAGALDSYIKFLKIGSKLDPVKSLKVAGVDMESSSLYDEVFAFFDKTRKELEDLYE